MCGIAAIFAYDSAAASVDERELLAIRDCMTSRGPDGAGEWCDLQRRVGLAHRRLSIIDLSPAGAQPMHWPEKKLAIVFNGEIYNYRELRAALEVQGHRFQSTSDTEVLLHLYAEHGEGMMNQLRGMYAFAIWDQEKRGLFLARDPFGIKPLYVADDGKTLRAASQVKALLAGGKVDTTPEPAGQVGFFVWGHVPEPYTMHRAIRALPVGTTLWVQAGGARRQKEFCSVRSLLSSPGNGMVEIGAQLRDSVSHHLIADVPVGVFLSSGLDSTTIAALAAEQGGALKTVTLGFEEYRGTPDDETPLAEKVAKQYGAQHQTISIKRADFQNERDGLLRAMDQPTIDGVNTYFVSLAARRAGLKVALSGLGGDELFGGYPSFSEIPRLAETLSLLPSGGNLGKAFRIVSAPVLKQLTSPKYAGLLEYGGSYGGAYLLRRGMFMPWELPEVLDGEIVREGWQELQTLARLDETASGLASPRARVSALEMNWYMRNQLLRDCDWASMAHSLEIRVPFVDATLLRALASALGSANPPTKREMADSPAKKLPPEILNRPKTGFQVPVRDWLQSDGAGQQRGLRGWAQQVFSQFARN